MSVEAESVTEYLRSEADRHGEAGGAEPEHFTGVRRWLYLVVGRNRADGLALLEHGSGCGPPCQQALQCSTVRGVGEAEGHQHAVALWLGGHPTLMSLTVERVAGRQVDDVVTVVRARLQRPRRRASRGGTDGDAAHSGQQGSGEHAAP